MRINVSPRQVEAESESLSQVISIPLGSQVHLLWGPTLCADDFFERLAPSSEVDGASEAESHGKRRIRDKSPGRGLAVAHSLRQRPWVSPFSVFCPHASFLSPPVAQPRSCQSSFSHLCALPLTLDFMALFLPQGPAF